MSVIESIKRVVLSKVKEKKEIKEFCMNCGQRTVHELVKDDQGEYWKVCKKCGKREYVGVLR